MTIQDLLSKIPPEKIKFMMANQAIMALDMGSKKKPSSVQIAMPSDVVYNLLSGGNNTNALLVLTVEREAWEKAVKEFKIND